MDDKGVLVETENYFCVVDLHAITMPHDPKELGESTLSSAALYLAAGAYVYRVGLVCLDRLFVAQIDG